MFKAPENKPLVSVVMPAYNAESYIEEAIRSILSQTHENIELIIVDDGSKDGTRAIANRLNDGRIRLITPAERLGLVASLNYGISLANGEFIARMDADDISHCKRLELQCMYLVQHPEVSVVGSQYYFVDENGRITGTSWIPSNSEAIKAFSAINSPMCHPSVMLRASDLDMDALYDLNCSCAEDYDLWVRMMSSRQFKNLGQRLVKYRKVGTSATATNIYGTLEEDEKYRKTIAVYKRIYNQAFSNLGLDCRDLKEEDYAELVFAKRANDYQLKKRLDFVVKYWGFLDKGIEDKPYLRRNMGFLWLKLSSRRFLYASRKPSVLFAAMHTAVELAKTKAIGRLANCRKKNVIGFDWSL